eukprot:TRINITY_DN844_c0_g1_i2.p1 TRINITY_DN844_c0_g1~~TRINITY_DN844_c0_g1_i2.p1  ORF type:complete len:386 (+),score=117.89 TRINITY_DN844_c0_g1_i2:300-1457(+)
MTSTMNSSSSVCLPLSSSTNKYPSSKIKSRKGSFGQVSSYSPKTSSQVEANSSTSVVGDFQAGYFVMPSSSSSNTSTSDVCKPHHHHIKSSPDKRNKQRYEPAQRDGVLPSPSPVSHKTSDIYSSITTTKKSSRKSPSKTTNPPLAYDNENPSKTCPGTIYNNNCNIYSKDIVPCNTSGSRWAGAAFSNAPPPSSLPLPSFPPLSSSSSSSSPSTPDHLPLLHHVPSSPHYPTTPTQHQTQTNNIIDFSQHHIPPFHLDNNYHPHTQHTDHHHHHDISCSSVSSNIVDAQQQSHHAPPSSFHHYPYYSQHLATYVHGDPIPSSSSPHPSSSSLPPSVPLTAAVTLAELTIDLRRMLNITSSSPPSHPYYQQKDGREALLVPVYSS